MLEDLKEIWGVKQLFHYFHDNIRYDDAQRHYYIGHLFHEHQLGLFQQLQALWHSYSRETEVV